MLIVISPAKNLDFDSALPSAKYSEPSMLDDSAKLIKALKKLAPHEVSALMGISDKLGQLNYERFQQWHRPFTPNNARPAIYAFNGDVYAGLQAADFGARELNFAQTHLRILSGLYGVLKPLDLIQAYRLEMGTRFQHSDGDTLYHFWAERLTEALNADLKIARSQTLINLASNEYFKALQPRLLQAEVITPVFKDLKNAQYKIISFFAKKARGRMTAYSIKNKITEAEQLKRFDWDGYQYRPELSQAKTWVFTRDHAAES